jgi:riboflavin synthase
MFTGLIERVGKLAGIEDRGEGALLAIGIPDWPEPLVVGESVAVEGVCLTVAMITARQFTCDVLKETLSRTTLGLKKPGTPLNLERALRADGRLGGHFVSGHVDGVGTVASIGRAGPDWVLDIACSEDLLGGMVFKGSIAVNGVSLTLAKLDSTGFSVHLIPHTWTHTSLHLLQQGDPVNLETDMLGKYVKGFLDRSGGGDRAGRLTLERLGEAGFL